jgi:hypothetical protein
MSRREGTLGCFVVSSVGRAGTRRFFAESVCGLISVGAACMKGNSTRSRYVRLLSGRLDLEPGRSLATNCCGEAPRCSSAVMGATLFGVSRREVSLLYIKN